MCLVCGDRATGTDGKPYRSSVTSLRCPLPARVHVFGHVRSFAQTERRGGFLAVGPNPGCYIHETGYSS